MFSALEIFLVMRYINLLFTYLLTYLLLIGFLRSFSFAYMPFCIFHSLGLHLSYFCWQSAVSRKRHLDSCVGKISSYINAFIIL